MEPILETWLRTERHGIITDVFRNQLFKQQKFSIRKIVFIAMHTQVYYKQNLTDKSFS